MLFVNDYGTSKPVWHGKNFIWIKFSFPIIIDSQQQALFTQSVLQFCIAYQDTLTD